MLLSRLAFLRRVRLALVLWSVAILSVGVVALSTMRLLSVHRTNAQIRSLVEGKDDATVTSVAPDQLVLARINQLISRERFDEAQALANMSAPQISPDVRAKILYNLANERTRRAIALVQKGDIDGATALVNLAKSEYRISLRLNPKDWNAKYNLDVAMRIVRDLPVGQADNDEIPPDAPKRIWTDLPGVPKGLP